MEYEGDEKRELRFDGEERLERRKEVNQIRSRSEEKVEERRKRNQYNRGGRGRLKQLKEWITEWVRREGKDFTENKEDKDSRKDEK